MNPFEFWASLRPDRQRQLLVGFPLVFAMFLVMVQEDPPLEDPAITKARAALDCSTPTSEEWKGIGVLAEALASKPIEGLDLAQRLEGAHHLAVLGESGSEARPEALATWRAWLEGLVEKAEAVGATLTEVAGVDASITELLALSE